MGAFALADISYVKSLLLALLKRFVLHSADLFMMAWIVMRLRRDELALGRKRYL